MQEERKWYESKSIWLAIIMATAAVLADPAVIAAIPLAWLPKITLAGAVLAVVVRILTNKPLGS